MCQVNLTSVLKVWIKFTVLSSTCKISVTPCTIWYKYEELNNACLESPPPTASEYHLKKYYLKKNKKIVQINL